MAVTARLRFGAQPSTRAPRILRGTALSVWCDFYDPETGQRVDASGVSAIAYAPSGAVITPAPTATEEAQGEWRFDLSPTFSGEWTLQASCIAPSAAVATCTFRVSAPEPDPALPPEPLDWGTIQDLLEEEIAAGVYYRTIEHYVGKGNDDTSGATDMREKLQAAMEASALLGEVLYAPLGERLLLGQVNPPTSLRMVCHPEADFVGKFNSAGNGAIVGMPSATWAGLPASAPKNVSISGGIWRRFGSLSADGKVWTGNTGNVFCFWIDGFEISALRITGYHLGRAIQPGGRGKIDLVDSFNPDNIHSLPCPGTGGTGCIRPFSGGPILVTRVRAVSGDDTFQAVPAALDSIGSDLVDITYDSCWGRSVDARVCVAALTVPNRYAEDLQGSQTIGIRSITFRNIRGEGKWACAFFNTDSSGPVGTILFDDVRLGIIRNLDGEAAPYGVDILGTNEGVGGVGPVLFRECELLNVIEGGIRCRGTQIGTVVFDGWKQPAPSNAASIYVPILVQDCQRFEMRRFSIAGAAGSTKSVVQLGSNATGTQVEYALFADGEVAGIEAARYAFNGATYGFTELDLVRVKMRPASGVTTARAVRFSEITERALLDNCDLTRLGAGPLVNVRPGVRWRDTRFPDASHLVQTVEAASTIAWDGRSEMIVLTGNGAATIETISTPAGWPNDRMPDLVLLNESLYRHVITGTGNIRPRGAGAALGPSQALRVVQQPVSGLWYPVRAETAIGEELEVTPVVGAGFLLPGASFSRAQADAEATYEGLSADAVWIDLVADGAAPLVATARAQAAAEATMESVE